MSREMIESILKEMQNENITVKKICFRYDITPHYFQKMLKQNEDLKPQFKKCFDRNMEAHRNKIKSKDKKMYMRSVYGS